MPMLTGVDFVKSLSNPPKVIFTTAYRDYAMEGYELNVVDYLLKPITFERFFKAVNKYLELAQLTATSAPAQEAQRETASAPDHLFINVNKKHHRVRFNEILYVESLKDYLRIHTEETSLVTKEKISEFSQMLPNNFIRIHRSFIVNKDKVTAFTATDVEIGEKEIPIGGNYKMEVMERLK